jgi:RNA polymerase sigma-70 factor (ECF subfamily)
VGWRDRRADGPDEPDPVEQAPAPFTDPVDGMDTERRMTRVWALVDELSPQQRAAVTLSCREGLATKDIAAVLSVSEATVRVHLHRALSTLRRRLGDEG